MKRTRGRAWRRAQAARVKRPRVDHWQADMQEWKRGSTFRPYLHRWMSEAGWQCRLQLRWYMTKPWCGRARHSRGRFWDRDWWLSGRLLSERRERQRTDWELREELGLYEDSRTHRRWFPALV